MGNKSNADIQLLKKFKDKYELTWSEVAEALGRKLGAIEAWYSRGKLPSPYKTLIQIYIDLPQVFNKYKGN